MRALTAAAFLLIAGPAARADDAEAIRAVLRSFNETARQAQPQPQALRGLFTAKADFRDAAGTLKRVDALISWFTSRQAWSERTPPVVKEDSLRMVAASAAFVDARLVQYGSMIVKAEVPVVLLFEREAGAWRISSWRMPSLPALFPPLPPK